MERILESKAVKQIIERGDDMEVVGGLGGGEEMVEEGRGIGGKGSAHKADMDGERDREGDEGGDEGISGVGERSGERKGFLEGRREG